MNNNSNNINYNYNNQNINNTIHNNTINNTMNNNINNQLNNNNMNMNVNSNINNSNNIKKKKKKISSIIILLLFIIVLLSIYIYYLIKNNENSLINNNFMSSPVSNNKKGTILDNNSTLVKDLYSKVSTNIKEDLANPLFDEKLKRYLAYRQIPISSIRSSTCNGFSNSKMDNFSCNDNEFSPKAFKKEKLELEYKKLFGDNNNFYHTDIILNSDCIIGFQYVETRDEYVEGMCLSKNTTSFKKEAKILKATSYNNMIVIEEDVKYIKSNTGVLPDSLKNGTYKYIFKLNSNYNYILVKKEYVNKY